MVSVINKLILTYWLLATDRPSFNRKVMIMTSQIIHQRPSSIPPPQATYNNL